MTPGIADKGSPFDVAIDDARRAWPGISLSREAFGAHLEAKRAAAQSPGHKLRISDLFLACACAHGDAVAIERFESAYFSEIPIVCARFPSLPVSLDDVRQRLREKLFLSDPPSIGGYSGQGDLRAWFRAAVLHLVLNITSRESREVPTDDCFFEAIVDASPTAEAAFLRRACRKEFEEAFVAAVAALPPREKSLLRYAFNDKLTIDEVGAIFRVHRGTAARWIQKAQLVLVEATRSALARRLGISEAEADSVVRGALSSLGTTLFRHFT
jgi:RNA polymerase sigma-70 factor (ECF subfamily)